MVIIGDTYGSMTITEMLPSIYKGKKSIRMVEVTCEACGTVSEKRLTNIQRPSTKGCNRVCPASLATNSTHGMSHTKVYKSWDNMVTRVTRPSHKSFKHYDDLIEGEKIDPNWLIFENFYKDMGEPKFDKSLKFSIDRIDNKLGYSKENCRWATQQEQLLNQERSVLNRFTIEDLKVIHSFYELSNKRGKTTISLKDIGILVGLGEGTMLKINKGEYFD